MKIKLGSGRTFARIRRKSPTPEHKARRAEVRAQRAAHRNAAYWSQTDALEPQRGACATILAWLCPDRG